MHSFKRSEPATMMIWPRVYTRGHYDFRLGSNFGINFNTCINSCSRRFRYSLGILVVAKDILNRPFVTYDVTIEAPLVAKHVRQQEFAGTSGDAVDTISEKRIKS